MSLLKQGVVIDVPAWKVPVIARKKLLNQPEIAVSVKFSADELKAMPDAQFKAFETSFEASFTPGFKSMSDSWFSDMQKTIDFTENAIEQLSKAPNAPADPKQLEQSMRTLVDKANAQLLAKCKLWTEMVQKLAQQTYDAAYGAALKSMKQAVTKAQAKMIAKVTLFVVLTLTAAALTIALAVATAGAGAAIAPVVIAGIATAGKALFGSVGEVSRCYDVVKTAIAHVEADAKKLAASTDASIKAMQKTAGKLDKASAFHAALSADVGALDRHVGELGKFVAVAQDSTKKRLAEIQHLADSLAKAKAGSPAAAKLEKDVLVAQRAFDDAMAKLKAIDDVKAIASAARAAFAALDPGAVAKALGRLAPALNLLRGVAAEVGKNGALVKTIASGALELAK